MLRKVFVDVVLLQDKDGKSRPLKIKWEDGTIYSIERLICRSRAASVRVGGGKMRYTVQICGKETFLFEEDGRWFVEAR